MVSRVFAVVDQWYNSSWLAHFISRKPIYYCVFTQRLEHNRDPSSQKTSVQFSSAQLKYPTEYLNFLQKTIFVWFVRHHCKMWMFKLQIWQTSAILTDCMWCVVFTFSVKCGKKKKKSKTPSFQISLHAYVHFDLYIIFVLNPQVNKKSHLWNFGDRLQMSLCPYSVLTCFALHTLSWKLILQFFGNWSMCVWPT